MNIGLHIMAHTLSHGSDLDQPNTMRDIIMHRLLCVISLVPPSNAKHRVIVAHDPYHDAVIISVSYRQTTYVGRRLRASHNCNVSKSRIVRRFETAEEKDRWGILLVRKGNETRELS